MSTSAGDIRNYNKANLFFTALKMVQTPVVIVHIKMCIFSYIYFYSKEYGNIIFREVDGYLMTSQLCDGYMLSDAYWFCKVGNGEVDSWTANSAKMRPL